MIVWPSKFKVLRDNFKEELKDRTLSSNMDIGPAKKRRRTYLVSSILSFSIIVKNEDYEEFKNFYYDNDFGVISFTRPDTGKIVNCRFNSVPTPTFNETFWTVSITLEVMP